MENRSKAYEKIVSEFGDDWARVILILFNPGETL